jgi:4-hydroxy-4-methyl-2-oxoglutarate aldolase
MTNLNHDYRERLARLDTCLVSDALDKLGLNGVVAGLLRLSTDKRVAGPVLTVRLEAAKGRVAERHLCAGAIEAAQPGEIIVVEHHSRSDCAGWGGILSRAARMRQIAGVIVDGTCRDIDESRELGFPVFGRGAVPVTARGRIIEASFNTPVTIGSVTVRPGDWVIADGSGVVFMSSENLKVIVEQAEKLAAREAELVADIEAGTPVGQVMSRTYEHMTQKEPRSE